MAARPPSRDTAARIQAAALELFATQGYDKTSLRQIADKLGLTKPALYYNFSSKEALLSSLVQPLIDDVEALLARDEAAATVDPRSLLESYFDVTFRHREVSLLVVRELSTLAVLDLGERVVDWRRRIMTLLVGPDPTLAAQTRAIVAIGGLADCTVMFPHVPAGQLRVAAVDAACAALGLPVEQG